MALSHAQVAVPHGALSGPVTSPARDHLALVPSYPAVFLTFADDVELRRAGPIWRRRLKRFPAGLVHAAEQGDARALCGTFVDRLEAFGRSRHPFERVEASRRCPACHVAAGRPTA
jgi:hypothetical protein